MGGPTASRARLRIGILGGTFDPPHVGHAIVAQDLVERAGLDRLLVIPAPDPPHRGAVFAAADRLAWVRKLFEGAERIEVDDLEHRRPGPSYTVDTMAELRERYAEAELLLIMGADQFRELDSWKEPRRVAELARIAVMRREGEEPAPPTGVGEMDYIVLDITRIDVSASRIRDRLREGRSIRFLVPEPIRPDIERAWANLSSIPRPEPARPGP